MDSTTITAVQKSGVITKITTTWQGFHPRTRWGLIGYGVLVLGHYGFSTYRLGMVGLKEAREREKGLTKDQEYDAIKKGCSNSSIFDSIVFPFQTIKDIIPSIILWFNSRNP
jgi:hypothetical protein